MITKIIWIVIGLNTVALVIFIGMFLFSMDGRKVEAIEKDWMFILFALGAIIILSAAIPLRVSQSTFSIIFSSFFAAMPLVVGSVLFISKKLPALKKQKTMAELYYSDETHRGIAAAIERGDTMTLRELIKGQNLNIQGNRVWDWDGLNYLQFTIRIRSLANIGMNEESNTAAIRILVEEGSSTTPALGEAISYLPIDMISLLLVAGADPNVRSSINPQPILFDAMGSSKREIEIAMLLIHHGADVNVTNKDGLTPAMFAANNAKTSSHWNEIWPFVNYLLRVAKCDYRFTNADGNNLQTIVRMIRKDAKDHQIVMAPEFNNTVEWLAQHGIDTEPAE